MSLEEQSTQSESLFDANFTSDQTSVPTTAATTTAPTSTTSAASAEDFDPSVLPTNEPDTTTKITTRVLVSVKEAGIIIGKQGSVIAGIREQTNVQAAVSSVVPGFLERILTVSGDIDSVAKALSLIVDSLINNNAAEEEFQYFPLKNLLSRQDDPNVISLRLLVPNTQIGSIIGKQGARIKALQGVYNVKLVASKDFLPRSNERLAELQGDSHSIEEALKILSKCLLEDSAALANVKYYAPSRFENRHYDNQHPYNSNSNNSNNGNSYPIHYGPESRDYEQIVKFPAEMVGCLIGKGGSRIQEIRKSTRTQIIISPEDDENFREFQLIGARRNVERALSYLNQNLEREKERRERLDAQ
ncbi:hypothetical protein WICPIJ_001045 [Wickerhamomyces pijperi]|uniref:K Homology domain-containing protein n=1 Tax=Wickerhamomyces pijperi TaxID=599730 RepID=A0A9P8QBP3_WICPI|nr:hypothetical protein WICPIJ_001045 [Wickerhamomyces pijperi]